MWTQTYTPVAGSLAWSALAAALPVFVLLFLIGVIRRPAWIAALAGLASAIGVAAFVYHMPPAMLASATLYGAAQGLLPIGWIVFTPVLLYRLTVEARQFENIKESIGSAHRDPRFAGL